LALFGAIDVVTQFAGASAPPRVTGITWSMVALISHLWGVVGLSLPARMVGALCGERLREDAKDGRVDDAPRCSATERHATRMRIWLHVKVLGQQGWGYEGTAQLL
jgi:hypothetical protein